MNRKGYTLIELMLVVAILSVLASIISPRYDLILQRAHQAKARSNLGTVRTAIALYYSETEGNYPLSGYPVGNSHYTSDGVSLSTVLAPRWINAIPIPLLHDRTGSFNGLSLDFDLQIKNLMTMSPPNDVFIVAGNPDYTPALVSPYAYDNNLGVIYIPNGNYDRAGNYFYTW
jgi:prepilin-type N-terminal cleavage/methylation domain-containing protein